MLPRVRCPAAGCQAVFEIAPVWLGRNMHCPTCGTRMTAKPADVEAQLQARQGFTVGQALPSAARLPLAVLVDNVRSLWNVGSIFRTADACGARQVVLAGITGCPPRAEIEKTALGAERAVSWIYRASAGQALAELAGAGFVPVAVEASARAVPLEDFAWPDRVALVVGNEVAGVSPEVLEACAHHVSIPMRGIKQSLNVAVAFGIAAHRAATVLDRAVRQAALVFVLLACTLTVQAAEPAPDSSAAISLPLTLDRVVFRMGSGTGLGKPFRSRGDLIVTAEGIEFTTRKRTIFIPKERIGGLSYGKMKGDLETDWAVISLGQELQSELVGVRDGSKLGFGTRTREIFERLKDGLKAAGAGQYRVPPGFQAFDGLEDHCAFAVPSGWDARVQSTVFVGDQIRWGAFLFAAEPLSAEGAGKPGSAGLARALDGEVPAFFIERSATVHGSDCDGLSEQARDQLIARAAQDRLFAPGSAVQPTSEAITIAGCHGVRVLARGSKRSGGDAVLEFLAVARGDAQFTFGVRAAAEHYESFRKPFSSALSTFHFAAGR